MKGHERFESSQMDCSGSRVMLGCDCNCQAFSVGIFSRVVRKRNVDNFVGESASNIEMALKSTVEVGFMLDQIVKLIENGKLFDVEVLG